MRARELAAAAADKEDALVAVSTRVELLTAELARVESVMHQESIKRTASDRAASIAKDALAAKSHEVRFSSTWFDKQTKSPRAAIKCIGCVSGDMLRPEDTHALTFVLLLEPSHKADCCRHSN